MKTTSEKQALIAKINTLQAQQVEDLAEFKEQLELAYDSIKPLNFIKNTLHQITSSSDIRSDLLHGAVNITTALIGKNLIAGLAETPIKKMINGILRFFGKKTHPKL
jgi:hypothetical protein